VDACETRGRRRGCSLFFSFDAPPSLPPPLVDVSLPSSARPAVPSTAGAAGPGPASAAAPLRPTSATPALPAAAPGTSVLVGNLEWWTTDADLVAAASAFGRLAGPPHFYVDRPTGRSKGAAVLRFLDPAAASAAVAGLNGRVFDGKPAVATLAAAPAPVTPAPRPPAPIAPAPHAARPPPPMMRPPPPMMHAPRPRPPAGGWSGFAPPAGGYGQPPPWRPPPPGTAAYGMRPQQQQQQQYGAAPAGGVKRPRQ